MLVRQPGEIANHEQHQRRRQHERDARAGGRGDQGDARTAGQSTHRHSDSDAPGGVLGAGDAEIVNEQHVVDAVEKLLTH